MRIRRHLSLLVCMLTLTAGLGVAARSVNRSFAGGSFHQVVLPFAVAGLLLTVAVTLALLGGGSRSRD